MDRLNKIQQLIICSIVNSRMFRSDKIDCLSYLFWNLCWDFDIKTLTQNIQTPPAEQKERK